MGCMERLDVRLVDSKSDFFCDVGLLFVEGDADIAV
jgi:hypothetical protein